MIDPRTDKVYSYCYVNKVNGGFQIDIVATVDGVNAEIDAPFFHWSGDYNNLESFLYLMFRNPIIKKKGF